MNRIIKILAYASRISVGLVFIFSGFVKGVDPLGTAYKIDDYFIAYGMEWAQPFSLFISIALCTLEFVLGVAMLLNLRVKQLAWPLLLLMLYFTVLTFFDAIYNPVPDCGCFGDAIKLTNWQTFYKNLLLLVPVLLIFFNRKDFNPWLMPKAGNLAILFIAAGFAIFSICQYRHLPWIDFLGWKTGTDLVPDNPGQAKVYLTYQNTVTGEQKEYLSPNYPWNDSTWLAEWVFVDQRIDDSGVIKGHTLQIFDAEGNDYTDVFVKNPDYQFIVASYSLGAGAEKGFAKIHRLYEDVYHDGHSFIIITGSLEDEIADFRQGLHPELEFFHADDIELKMMVRANPGLILLKDGVVMGKWHWRDIPAYEELKAQFDDL